jgi:hypothetical protein
VVGGAEVALEALGGGAQARLQRRLLDAGTGGARLARGAGADREGAVEEDVGEEDPAQGGLGDRPHDPPHGRVAGELADEDLVGEHDVLGDLRRGPAAGAEGGVPRRRRNGGGGAEETVYGGAILPGGALPGVAAHRGRLAGAAAVMSGLRSWSGSRPPPTRAAGKSPSTAIARKRRAR